MERNSQNRAAGMKVLFYGDAHFVEHAYPGSYLLKLLYGHS